LRSGQAKPALKYRKGLITRWHGCASSEEAKYFGEKISCQSNEEYRNVQGNGNEAQSALIIQVNGKAPQRCGAFFIKMSKTAQSRKDSAETRRR
jgi:hypothetical protein